MADDKIYMDLELRSNLEKQIKEDITSVEKLEEVVKRVSEMGIKIDSTDKWKDNIKRNVGDAEKALYKLMEAKEKADAAIARNNSFKAENIYGFDDSKLQRYAAKLDEIIQKVTSIGAEAAVSKNYVKNMMAEMSADTVVKTVNASAKDIVGQIDKEEKQLIKDREKAAREAKKAQDEEDEAAANNLKNQQKIQDAMAKIATARNNLSKASSEATQQEQMHVELLMKLLDRLSQKLASMRGQTLGGKDSLAGVLGSGYQGLMRNVTTAIADLTSGRMNTEGMSEESWNAEKLLATRKEIINTFEKEFENQEKVNRLVRERQEMEAHRKARETAKDEAEMKVVADQINKELAERERLNRVLDMNKAAMAALQKVTDDTTSQQKIAVIRNQTVEYNALEQKLRSLAQLYAILEDERRDLENGTKQSPSFTRERITQELDRIQRQYNETLARGKQAAIDEADAQRKNADAKRRTAEAAKELNRVNADMVNSFNRVLDRVTHSNKMFNQLQQQFAGYVGIYGLERLLKNVIQIGGEFEVQHIALQSILGDVQQANSMFEQMKELAVVSPFNFRQLAAYSKQIAAFNIPYDEMYDTTKRLADMAAGLGVDMGRLILAYGQVRSAAVLRGQELRQFTEAGIPMVQALANEFTKLNGRAVSTAEVFELISKRAVPFEMVKKVMWDMTDEGGRFFDMQFVLSDTLAGKWSNLQDAWEIMLSEFAKGESLSGQFLKSMVTLITKLTEAVNTLTPLLAGGAMFYGMRKMMDYTAGLGLAGIDARIKKAQQLQAIELRRKLINQEITAEEYKQSMIMNNSKTKYYVLLANEGKLKDYQIQKLLLQNKINNARLHELVASKELTMREAAQIRLWRMKNGEVSAFSMRMKGMMTGIGTFLKANVWLLAIDAIITGLTTWYAKAEETRAKNEELTKSFENAAKELKEAYASMDVGKEIFNSFSDEEYKNGIDGLKEMLKQHSSNYEAVIRHANGLKTLREQYIYLKQAIYDEQKVIDDAADKAEKFGDTTRDAFEKANEYARYMTTGRQSFWDVMFGADTDVKRGLDKSVKNLYNKILEVVPDVGKNEYSNELYRKLRDSLEEQMGFGSKEKMLINIKLNELFNIDNIEDATTLVVSKFSEMLSRVEPQIANKIRYGQELNDAEKEKVAQLVNEATEETKSRYPYYADTLQKLLNDSNFVANIQLRFSTSGQNVNEFQKWIYGNMSPMLSEDIKNIATNWGTSGSSFDAQNAAKRDIDAAKNELEVRKKQTALSQKRLDEARKQKKNDQEIAKLQQQREEAGKREAESLTLYENRKRAALEGLGYDYEGELKKSNKTKTPTKGKDAALEQAKVELDFIKKFYQEYKKYRDVYGPEKGQSLVEEIFGMNAGQGDAIVKDYKARLQKVLSDLGNITPGDREKFAQSVKQLLGDINLDEIKETAKKVADAIKEELQRQGEQWNLYDQLFKQTGSKEFSMAAFGDVKIWNDQALSLAESLKKAMESNLKSDGKLIIDWDAEERAAEDYYKRNFDNGEALYEMWLAIVKLLRGNYTDALKESGSVLEESMTYAQRAAAVMAKYEEKIRDAKKIENNDAAVYALEKKRDSELADIQAEQLRDSINWDAVFGNLSVYTKDVLRGVRNNIKEWIKLNRNKADIKVIKEMTEGLSKINTAIGEQGGLFGGLNEAYKQAKIAKELLDNAKQVYELAKGLYGEDSSQAEDAKKKLQYQQGVYNSAIANVDNERNKATEKLAGTINTLANFGKKSDASLSEVGSFLGTIITSLSKTNTAMGNIIAAIFTLCDALGKDPQGFFDNIGKNLGNGIYGINQQLNLSGNITKTLTQWDESVGINNPLLKLWNKVEGLDWMKPIDDSAYEDALRKYQELIKIWDDLIGKKTTYLEKSWGTEALQAGKETIDLLKNLRETEQILARERLKGGASHWTHSYNYRMWEGTNSFDGKNWKDVAGEISNALGGVKFTEMADMVDMTSEQLRWIMENYSGLWSKMNTEFREHLENIIKYGEQTEDTIEKIKEKLTGWNLDTIKSEWADLLATMENGTDKLAENLEEKLKNAILNSMIDNLYTKRIQALIDSVSQNEWYVDKNGNVKKHNYDKNGNITDTDVASEFTPREYEEMMNDGKSIAEDATAIRDMLKDMYGWRDDQSSSSSASNTIKGVTEQTADLIASYLNAIRADVSVNRVTLGQILVAVQGTANLPVIAQSQLEQLRTLVQLAKDRTGFVSEIRDILHRASEGGNAIRIK